MQALAVIHGASIQHAPEPIHGRLSQIQHTGHRLFHNIPSGKLHRMSTMHCNTPHVPMTKLLHTQHPSTAAQCTHHSFQQHVHRVGHVYWCDKFFRFFLCMECSCRQAEHAGCALRCNGVQVLLQALLWCGIIPWQFVRSHFQLILNPLPGLVAVISPLDKQLTRYRITHVCSAQHPPCLHNTGTPSGSIFRMFLHFAAVCQGSSLHTWQAFMLPSNCDPPFAKFSRSVTATFHLIWDFANHVP